MKLVKIVIFLLGLAPTFIHGQTLYDLRWQYQGIEYAGFMIYFDETDIYMRSGYSVNNQYNLVHSEFSYILDQQSSDFVMMEAESSHYVYNPSDNQYQDFHFMWIQDDEGWLGPFAATTAQILNDDYDNFRHSLIYIFRTERG